MIGLFERKDARDLTAGQPLGRGRTHSFAQIDHVSLSMVGRGRVRRILLPRLTQSRGSGVSLPTNPGTQFISRRSSSPRLVGAAVACTAAVQFHSRMFDARKCLCWQAIGHLLRILHHNKSLSSVASSDGSKTIGKAFADEQKVIGRGSKSV